MAQSSIYVSKVVSRIDNFQMNIYSIDQDSTYLMLTDVSRSTSVLARGKNLVDNVRKIRHKFHKDVKLPQWVIDSGYIRVQLDFDSCVLLKTLNGPKMIDTYEEKFESGRLWVISKHVTRDIFHGIFFPYKPKLEPVKIRRRG